MATIYVLRWRSESIMRMQQTNKNMYLLFPVSPFLVLKQLPWILADWKYLDGVKCA